MNLKGHVDIYDGNELIRSIPNLVVDTGKVYLVSLMRDGVVYAGDYIAVGSGSTAPDASDTTLSTEIARVSGTTDFTDNVITVDVTFEAGTPATEETFEEAGLFTASSGGTMVARTTFAAVTKPVIDGLRIVWTITVG